MDEKELEDGPDEREAPEDHEEAPPPSPAHADQQERGVRAGDEAIDGDVVAWGVLGYFGVGCGGIAEGGAR